MTKPAAYYNEIDPFAAQWLRNLIAEGHIAPGDVDERSIEDVIPDELIGYSQCHFFAGIGVWSYALRRAGWPDDRQVWTGSCPCQPFSSAGKGEGFDDERHLWPAFFHLIQQRLPSVVLGEQVASKDADYWIDLVQDDMEGMDYAFGAIPFPSASVGAPHIRDRLFWVAYMHENGRQQGRKIQPICQKYDAKHGGAIGRMADTNINGPQRSAEEIIRGTRWREKGYEIGRGGASLADSISAQASPTNGFWADADWLLCREGNWRPVEPGTFPLVNGAPARVGRLRAYGNAINAEAAKEFIGCVMECIP